VVAGTLFFLPAAVLLWGLSWSCVTRGKISWVAGIFYGLKPAVVAIVAAAMIRFGQISLTITLRWMLALAGFALVISRCQWVLATETTLHAQ
jgi:chromate transporter